MVSVDIWAHSLVHVRMLRNHMHAELQRQELLTLGQTLQVCSSRTGLALTDLSMYLWGKNRAVKQFALTRRVCSKAMPSVVALRRRFLSLDD